MSQKIYLDW